MKTFKEKYKNSWIGSICWPITTFFLYHHDHYVLAVIAAFFAGVAIQQYLVYNISED